MAQIANIEYFYRKCNQRLNTLYTANSKQAINIAWLVAATRKVYNDIHSPKIGCRLLLSSAFTNTSKIAVDVTLVNKVVEYLRNFNKICDPNCACPCGSSNCYTDCGTCSQCCNACACDCGSPTECVCDCSTYWNCNCTNLNYCSSQCACACNCCDDCCHNDDCRHSDSHTDKETDCAADCTHKDSHSDDG